MSDIIESANNPIKLTDHVYVKTKKDGSLTLRTNTNTKKPKGIYMLTLKGFGVIYLGISGTDRQNARGGVKDRWINHGWKLTGLSFKNRSDGEKQPRGRAEDTKLYANFRKVLVEKGYDLDTILDHIEVRFIPLGKSNKQKIEAMEGFLLMSLIANGQCILNSSKRIPALTKEEYDYISDQKFLPEGFVS